MKDMITTIASILILMMFLLQFTANQSAYVRILGAEHAVREFRAASELKGEVSVESVSDLKSKLSDMLNCDSGEIQVSLNEKTSDDDGRLQITEYSVKMPVYDVIGPDGILNLTEMDNVAFHISEGNILIKSPEPETKPKPEVKTEI